MNSYWQQIKMLMYVVLIIVSSNVFILWKYHEMHYFCIKNDKIMQLITLKVTENKYDLFLQYLKTLSYVEVVKPLPSVIAPKPTFDFSDIAGKLQWKGDAIEEQRRLRDEW